MRLCVEHGADPNWADKEGTTVLYDACERGHVDAARLLLNNGAEVDRAVSDGWQEGQTPLFIACEEGHVDAARLLLDKGAAVDRANKRGRRPLDIAKRNDHDAVVALLEEHLDSKFPLHAAARTGDVEAMTRISTAAPMSTKLKGTAQPPYSSRANTATSTWRGSCWSAAPCSITTAAPSAKATRSRLGIEAARNTTLGKSAVTAARASTISLTTTETGRRSKLVSSGKKQYRVFQ